MIDLKNLSAEWIAEKRKKYSKDPTLMESMIYALYLLEQSKCGGERLRFYIGACFNLRSLIKHFCKKSPPSPIPEPFLTTLLQPI